MNSGVWSESFRIAFWCRFSLMQCSRLNIAGQFEFIHDFGIRSRGRNVQPFKTNWSLWVGIIKEWNGVLALLLFCHEFSKGFVLKALINFTFLKQLPLKDMLQIFAKGHRLLTKTLKATRQCWHFKRNVTQNFLISHQFFFYIKRSTLL